MSKASKNKPTTLSQNLFPVVGIGASAEVLEAFSFTDAIIAALHEPLLVLDKNCIIKSANKSFYKTFQLTEKETIDKVLFELQNNGWNIPS